MRTAARTFIRRRPSFNPRLAAVSCNNTLHHHETNTTRTFALAAEVGRGNSKVIIDPAVYERTPEQKRAASTEHERMIRATHRLLELDTATPLSSGDVQELRVVFHYWTGSRSHVIRTTNGDAPTIALQHAERLLDWMLSNEKLDPESLYTILKTDDCASGALINMMEQCLLPFRGTHQSLKTAVSDRRIRSHKHVNVLKSSLYEATLLMDRIETLLDDSSYAQLVPDEFVYNMMLNLWVKRCWFLAEHCDSLRVNGKDKEFVATALKGATNVKQCLSEMKECIDSLPPDADPTSKVTLYLTAWVNSGLPYRAEKARDILRQAEDDDSVQLTAVAYNAVMSAYASLASKEPKYAIDAEHLFTHMADVGIEHNVATYSSLLLTHARAGGVNSAVDLLHLMEEGLDDDSTDGPFPNTICYNIVLDALAKSGTDKDVEQADRLLRRMQAMSDSGKNKLAAPDTVSYSSVIQAWSRSSRPDAAERAEALLFQCRELSATNKSVAPDVVMYNIVLNAWAGLNKRQKHQEPNDQQQVDETGAQRAESLLQRMKESDEVRPDVFSYNILMNAWFNSGNYEKAAKRARELLVEMKRGFRAGNASVKPDGVTYNTAIKLVSRSRKPKASNKARALMMEMEKEGLEIHAVTCNTVMDAMIKSGEPKAIKQAEEMFRWMEEKYRKGNKSIRPGEITYNILLHAYAKSKDPKDAKKAERLLHRMEKDARRDESLTPSVQTYATVLDMYAKSGQSKEAESLFDKMGSSGQVQANTVSYNTVLNALAKSKDEDAPYRAEALLNRMQQEYEAGNKQVQPNPISFSCVINSWAKSSLDGNAERAEAILTRMEDLAARGTSNVTPNVVSYSTVLSAWANSRTPDSADRAIAILERMESANENGNRFTKPNAYCYNATMNAIAKSNMPDKAARAYEMLQQMIRAYENGNDTCKPSVTSFTTVLNACAYTENSPELQKEAFRLARTTFAQFIESPYGEPNVVTYVNFLTACSRLLPPGAARDNIMAATFAECCKAGLVNDKVVNILQRAVDPVVFEKSAAMMKRL